MPSATGILTINLDAIVSNWRYMRDVAMTADVGAVIKANAYSLGAKVVAETLYGEGCHSFFVTTLEEAFEIKSVLKSDALIYVLAGVRSGDEDIFANEKYIPVIYSMEMLLRWTNYCEAKKQNFPTAIKIDTGMSRFGMSPEDFLTTFPHIYQKITTVLLMSHLACADDSDHYLNRIQLVRFESLLSQIKGFIPSVKASLANSSGIFLGKEWHFDLVRPGAALYGINPQKSTKNPLKQVVHLRLPVLQIKYVDADVTVGYSAIAKAKIGSRLAVVSGGYADGINKTLGYKPIGICCGEKVSAIGRVSMDATIFDLSCVNATDQEIFDSGVEVISESRTLDDLTTENDSLGYEVLTGMGSRYQRIYVRKE